MPPASPVPACSRGEVCTESTQTRRGSRDGPPVTFTASCVARGLGGCWRTPPVASGGQVVSPQGGRRRYRGCIGGGGRRGGGAAWAARSRGRVLQRAPSQRAGRAGHAAGPRRA